MASYQGARAHYLSPRRRDPVKIRMEELVSHDIFAHAVRRLRLPAGQPLRVLDVGSGTGDGLALLTEPHGDLEPVTSGYQLRYLGLDADPTMVETARSLHPAEGVAFEVGDIRDWPADGAFDLYLSCGVPYSHLTVDEVGKTLTSLFRQIVRAGRRAALVVDVLGRYSVEWQPNWPHTRWDYAMTFFEDTAERLEEPMKFFDRASLGAVIAAAAEDAEVRPAEVTFTDRSILVGRHTATRAFNPAIPPYRSLLNNLAQGSSAVPPSDLRFTAPRAGAPRDVLAFFREWEQRWNALLERAGEPDVPLDPDRAVELAAALLRHERQAQRGLGAGHSLTATVIVDTR
ncbi:MAG: methyltransferase domain-containing protein [Pseudonocardiaceae bacterium]|nr:methyltransferase domain-containing protein [Pseudonocardiaceae bacterium]